MENSISGSSSGKIICAIDTPDIGRALALLKNISPYIGVAKLGLEFFTANGRQGVEQIASETGLDIFLDLKFYDIPNTVGKAVAQVSEIESVKMTTIHASGGQEMMQAAVKNAREDLQILAVTVLTSMSSVELGQVNIGKSPQDQVLDLAQLAQGSGIGGLVCSGQEIEALRSKFGKDFNLVVPGMRPENSQSDDQKRVLTPKQAVDLGADYLVIGRPITNAPDPTMAAKNIAESL